MVLHFDNRSSADHNNQHVTLKISFDWDFYHKMRDPKEKLAFMQRVGGEANLNFLLQVGQIWGSKGDVLYATEIITKFLKAFNLLDYVHLLFCNLQTEVYRNERNVEVNTRMMVSWLKKLITDQNDPKKRFNFRGFKWSYMTTEEFWNLALDEKVFNVQSILDMNFRALWIDKVDNRFMKLANVQKLRIYMEDDHLDTMKHFFNYLYQDGCQLKELKLYNSDK